MIISLMLISSLIINEVMANPLGPESGSNSPGDRNEFVELFNNTENSMNINGYYIADKMEKDSLIPYPDSSILNIYPGCVISYTIPAYGFAVILDRDYLNAGENPIPYAIDSGTVLLSTYDTDIGNGLANTDWLILLNGNNDTIDSYGTPSDTTDNIPISAPDGFSVERVNPFGNDEASNWKISRDSSGSTPSRKNSWTFAYNLSVDSLVLNKETYVPGDTLWFTAFIENTGYNEIDSFSVLYGISDMEKKYITVPVMPYTLYKFSDTLFYIPEGYNPFEFQVLLKDEDSTDNVLRKYVACGQTPVVINEIMYNDEVEWIEIFNNNSDTVWVGNFTIMDRSGTQSDKIPQIYILPYGFLVFVSDSSFATRFPGVPFTYLPHFPSLNNSSETVYLIDNTGTIVDSVHYTSSYGGAYGKSMEKVNPVLPSSSAGSWGTCQDVAGGTPCKKNSIYEEEVQHKDYLSFSSKIVKYNSSNNRILISYNVPEENTDVSFYLFRLDGKCLGKIYGEKSYENRGSFLWYGTTPQGEKLKTGAYILYFEAEGKKIYKQKVVLGIEE